MAGFDGCDRRVSPFDSLTSAVKFGIRTWRSSVHLGACLLNLMEGLAARESVKVKDSNNDLLGGFHFCRHNLRSSHALEPFGILDAGGPHDNVKAGIQRARIRNRSRQR